MNVSTGTLKGKEVARAYWEKALKLKPQLHFGYIFVYLLTALSFSIKVTGGFRLKCFFDAKDKVESAFTHYE